MSQRRISEGLSGRTTSIPTDFHMWKGNKSQTPAEAVTAIAFQNLHGLLTTNSTLDIALNELIDNMDHYNLHMLCVSEHHMATANHRLRKRIHDTIRKIRPGQILHQFHSGPETDRADRLVGGTGIIALGPITGRTQPGGRGGDSMGRWSVIHLRRFQMPPVSIISVYQVCQSPTNPIGDTAWHQQRRFLDIHNRHEHPRVAFIQDLTRYIQSLQQKQHDIVVGGDWNDWLGSPRSQLMTMCTRLNLVDPWAKTHPDDLDFATFEFGQHRIDSVFVSLGLQEAITAVRYTPGGMLFSTDHRAVILEFNTNVLFGKTLIDPTNHQTERLLRSKDKISVTTFVETMYQHLLHHNAMERSARLEATSEASAHELAEQLDQLVGEAGEAAERRLRKRRKPWYSSKLVSNRQAVSLLRYHVNGLKARIDRSSTIQKRLQHIQVNVSLPTTIEEAKTLLLKYEQQLREATRTSESHRRNGLTTSADVADKLNQSNKAIAIRRINKCEQNLNTWKILTFMSNRGKTQKLDQLEIPSSWPSMHDTVDPSIPLEDPKTTTSLLENNSR